MIKILRFSLMVILVLLVSCQAEPSVTIEDLVGIWQRDGAALVIQLNEDGSIIIAGSKYLLEDFTMYVEQFQLEGTLFTITTPEDGPSCKGKTGTYEVELTEEGKLHFTLIEEGCFDRGYRLTRAPWRLISP